MSSRHHFERVNFQLEEKMIKEEEIDTNICLHELWSFWRGQLPTRREKMTKKKEIFLLKKKKFREEKRILCYLITKSQRLVFIDWFRFNIQSIASYFIKNNYQVIDHAISNNINTKIREVKKEISLYMVLNDNFIKIRESKNEVLICICCQNWVFIT